MTTSGPQETTIGNAESRQSSTSTRSSDGHPGTGPSGVAAQSIVLNRSRISPGPGNAGAAGPSAGFTGSHYPAGQARDPNGAVAAPMDGINRRSEVHVSCAAAQFGQVV